MYKFITVQCPYCEHQFTWLKGSWSTCVAFRRKGHDEILESTVCPMCGIEMVVIKELHTGIDINDESIEVLNFIRGI